MVNHGHYGPNPGGDVNDVDESMSQNFPSLGGEAGVLSTNFHSSVVTSLWSQEPPVARKSLQTDNPKCLQKEGGHVLKGKYPGTMDRTLRVSIGSMMLSFNFYSLEATQAVGGFGCKETNRIIAGSTCIVAIMNLKR